MNTSGIESREKVRVPLELLANSGFVLVRLGIAVKHRALERVEEAGFDSWHYGVLAVLGEGERQTQATIGHSLRVDPSQLVSVLDSLEDKGLVQRRRDPEDRRRHLVNLTSDGKRQ